MIHVPAIVRAKKSKKKRESDQPSWSLAALSKEIDSSEFLLLASVQQGSPDI